MVDRLTEADNTGSLLDQANIEIRRANLERASGLLEKALSVNFESDDVVSALKFVNFWREREKQLTTLGHGFERGQYILEQWPLFEAFLGRMSSVYEEGLQAIRQYAFRTALEAFESLLVEGETQDPELLLRIGRCQKGLGAYDESVRFLEAAAAEKTSDAEATAELADAYALINETKAAKAFFREAFFLDPQQVHLELLESQMIRALTGKVRDLGMEGPKLHEWLPVYGVLFGVFNIKRELRSIEYGKLKQSIYALERELREGRDKSGLVEPRLINHYFWLIDHLVSSKEDSSKVDEVLLKLRSVNERIYRQYTN